MLPDRENSALAASKQPGTSSLEQLAGSSPANDESPPRDMPTIFVHESPRASRVSHLRVGIIADGTSRGGPNGLAEGAARVVECAEHCAKRDDVSMLAVFVLSPENLEHRSESFFAALHAEFLRLLEAVTSGRSLAGVCVDICGDVSRLLAKGGSATRLAHVLALLREATAEISDPRLRLVFGVDYGNDSALMLGLDVLVRTGMEKPYVLRLSGLRVRPCTLCIPSQRLWRHFSAAELDDALALAAQHRQGSFACGYTMDFVIELVTALTTGRCDARVQLIVPVAASPDEVGAALSPLAADLLRPSSDVAVTALAAPGSSPRRFGPADARIHIHLLAPTNANDAGIGQPIAWLAPGQSSPVFRLTERQAAYANVHTCAPTPAGIIEGVERALRFHEAHPPLRGAPRGTSDTAIADMSRLEAAIAWVASRADTPSEELARENFPANVPLGAEHLAPVFAAKCVSAARSAGLVSGEVDWRRQAFGYALTAFAIGGPRAADMSRYANWEPPAQTLALVMLALASSDEEITDRTFLGEVEAEKRGRLATSVEYLVARVRGKPCILPDVRGRERLEAIGNIWDDFFVKVGSTAEPTIVRGVRTAAVALYRANMAERALSGGQFAAFADPTSSGVSNELERLYLTAAPDLIATRMRTLLRNARDESQCGYTDAWRELRLLCWLTQMAPSIGAGCALHSMAATEPAELIPVGGAAMFRQITPLLDYYFRLVNDLAFTDATRGDRDDKPNAYTCLLTPGLSGQARERDCVTVLKTCQFIAVWLATAIESAMDELDRVWPVGACWLRRGMRFGSRVYKIGHYERMGSDALTGMIVDLEELSPPSSSCREDAVVDAERWRA